MQILSLHRGPFGLGIELSAILRSRRSFMIPGRVKVELQWRPLSENQSTLHDVLQLSHIAGPFVILQTVHLTPRDLRLRQVQTRAGQLDEVRRQLWNIFTPFPQQRDLQREHTETIEQI